MGILDVSWCFGAWVFSEGNFLRRCIASIDSDPPTASVEIKMPLSLIINYLNVVGYIRNIFQKSLTIRERD